MKNLFLSAALILLSATAAFAQTTTTTTTTNTAPAPVISPLLADNIPVLNLLTNIPTVSFADETFGVSVGTVMHGASTFENSLDLEYVIHTNFAVMGEIQNGTGSDVINSAGAFFKVRKPGINYEIYALGGIRRDWTAAQYQAVVGFGAAYKMTSSVAAFAEQRLVDAFTTSQPQSETVVGIKLCF